MLDAKMSRMRLLNRPFQTMKPSPFSVRRVRQIELLAQVVVATGFGAASSIP